MRPFGLLVCLSLTVLSCGATFAQSHATYFRDHAAGLATAAPSAETGERMAPTSGVTAMVPTATPFPRVNGWGAGSIAKLGWGMLDGLAFQLRAPLRYARQHPRRVAIGLAGVLALIATDHATYPVLHDLSDGAGHGMQRVTDVGDGRNGLYLVGGLGLLGVATGSGREQRTSIALAQALVTSALWTEMLKSASGRERPREMEEERAEWEGPALFSERDEGVGLRSFPSGHATGAWAAATVLARQYPYRGIVPIIACTGAAAISYSRIAVGAHWLSDVVVGAVIGVSSARAVLSGDPHGTAAPTPSSGPRLGIDASPAYKGVHVKYSF